MRRLLTILATLLVAGTAYGQNTDDQGNPLYGMNFFRYLGATPSATNPLPFRLSDGTAFYDSTKTGQLPAALVGGRLDVNVGNTPTVTANAGTGTFNNQQSNVQLDFDTGAGTQNMTLFGMALPASGGAVAGGTATNPFNIAGTVTANAGTGTFTVSDPTFTDATGTTVPANAAFVAGTDGTSTRALKTDAGGELQTDVLSSALPTGASTLAEQQTQTTALQIIDNLPVAQGSTTAGQSGALGQGAVTTAAPTYTTGQTSPLSLDTAGNLRVTGGGGGTQYIEDDVAAANPTGTQPVLVRDDTPNGQVSADGDVIAQRGTNFGAAYVQVVNSSGTFVDTFGGSGGTAQADESAFTEGTTNFTPVGGVLNDTITSDPTEDQAAAARITAKRGLHVNLRNVAGTEIGTSGAPVRTDTTGTTTQPVSGTVTATQGGAPWTQQIQDGDVAGEADVMNSAPTGSEYGVVVRNLPSGTQAVSGTLSLSDMGPFPSVNGTLASLNALNAAASVQVKGRMTTGFELDAGTLTATITAECSYDDGTNYDGTGWFFNPSTLEIAQSFSVTNPNGRVARTIICSGGATNARARVSSFTSGAADGHCRANTTSTEVRFANLRNAAGGEIGTATDPVNVEGTVTANQGTPAATANRWPTQITDGTDLGLVTAAGEVNVLASAQPGVDIGDVTINNAAGASAVNIQDGGNSITVDGTVTANAGTGNFNVVGTKSNNGGTPGATNLGTLPAVANAAAPTQTEGNQVALRAQLDGDLVTVMEDELPAGTQNIGDVDVATLPAVTQSTASSLNAEVQGDAASGAAKSGNPVQIGGVFNTTQPTVTTGQVVEAQATARGALIVASGVDAITTTLGAGSADAGNVNIEIGGAALSATNPVPTRASDGAAFIDAREIEGQNNTRPIFCQDSVPISTATSGNVELVALTGGQTIYVCGWDFIADGTVGVQLISGTGTACATGETDRTGVYSVQAREGKVTYSGGGSLVTKTASGEALCIELSAAIQVNGVVSYAKF